MREELSSSLTFAYKYLGTAASCALFGFAIFNESFGRPYWGPFGLLFWSFGILFAYWMFGRLKKVEISESTLFISNYLKSVEVPLHDVESVSGSILLSPELVWIRFRRPTEFGDKIVFMAKWRPFAGWSRHPVVHRLRDLLGDSLDQY